MNATTHPKVLVAVTVFVIVALIGVYALFPSATTPEPTPAPPVEEPGTTPVAGGCVVGGCSGQICSDEKDGPAVSDCMYRAEYECYDAAKCERQESGECGWTPSPALTACLANPPAIE